MDFEFISRYVSGNIGIVLHAGAGHCSELDTYRKLGAERLIFVEASPVQAAALKRRTVSLANTEVLQSAVTGYSGRGTLRIMNMPEASSLRAPAGLIDLFPGAKVERELEVECLRPQEILPPEQLDTDKDNWLIVDVPGEEMSLIEALADDDTLRAFNRIVLRCGTAPLYRDSTPAADILDFLIAQGFEIREINRYTDPDRPEWLLIRNDELNENMRLREQLVEALQARREFEQKLFEARRDLSVSEKRNRLLEGDLEELRDRYEAGRAEAEEQRQLLARLGENLADATAAFKTNRAGAAGQSGERTTGNRKKSPAGRSRDK